MKTSELRIGNYIEVYRKPEDKEMSVRKIQSIFFYQDEYFVELVDDFVVNIERGIQPILLTEEWLLKFGFEKKIANLFINAYMKDSFYLTIREDGELFYEWNGGNIHIKYIHQLQNLYFALVGKELSFKLVK